NITDVSVPGTGYCDEAQNGRIYFNALRGLQRPGLALNNGVVYVGYASHGDNNPYHGWLIGYDAQTLQLRYVMNTTPEGLNNPNPELGGRGGFWQSGGAPSFDADGNIYFSTGNGAFDAYTTPPPGAHALGDAGGGLGYAGIQRSVAIKFDAYKPSGNHSSTGIYYNGVNPDNTPAPPS